MRRTAETTYKKGGNEDSHKGKLCSYCARSHKKGKEHCPAYGQQCKKCGKKNHFAVMCKLKERKTVHEVCDEDDDFDDDDLVLHVNGVSNAGKKDEYSDDVLLVDDDQNSDVVFHVDGDDKSEKSVHAKMLVGQDKTNVIFQLDSGATINSFSVDTYKTVTGDSKLTDLQRSDKRLLMYDKSVVKPLGERILSVKNPQNNSHYKVRFIVVEGKVKSILGCRAIQHMGLVTVNKENIAVITDNQKTVISEFKDVFEGELGRLEGDLHLVVDPTVHPVKLPCRKWPSPVKEKVKGELERLQELGVVTPVNVPTDWVNSLVVTMKPNGKPRLCIDPKPLNKALKRNHYPMKTIDDALEDMVGARYFTHMDAKNGFWHVVMDEESSMLTTFETPFGKFRWKRMPFGVSVSPEEFQRRIDDAVKGLPGVFAVHDDFIIWGKLRQPTMMKT
ncbi:hypothetical protein V1264_014461 [Littorina saxatilis]|uniref:Reverse transcriptase domain-containing protein n=1 Tax=Littorina saxatilis TaxID=31220 RepID=A0AAN9BQD9_9CAEN